MAEEYMTNRPNKVPTLNNLVLKTADGEKTINHLTKSNDPNKNSISESQSELMNEVENNNDGFEMVNRKGSSFPMIEKDPVEMQKEEIMKQQGLTTPEPNRAGSAVSKNMLVNDPNNPQPMNKVAASTVGREQMFNEMAMNKGERFEQPGATTTPQAPMFPNQQGSFASYADAEGGLKEMMEKLKKKRNTKVGKPLTPEKPKYPAMYDGLSKALVGDQDELPDPLQKEILDAPGMYNRAHTKITKHNVNSAMKDDAAHISYLKRDINYDNRHGGSNKQMTADEKHISKLAGDIKYDVKKKRKYDNV